MCSGPRCTHVEKLEDTLWCCRTVLVTWALRAIWLEKVEGALSRAKILKEMTKRSSRELQQPSLNVSVWFPRCCHSPQPNGFKSPRHHWCGKRERRIGWKMKGDTVFIISPPERKGNGCKREICWTNSTRSEIKSTLLILLVLQRLEKIAAEGT